MTGFKKLLFVAVAATLPAMACAQLPETLRAAVEQAVLANPEVQARFHAFRAAENERDAARSGYLPTLDVDVAVGRELRRPSGANASRSYDRFGGGVTLSQMLYDGFFTRSEVARFGHARMVRYFELLDDAEQVAFEALRAYIDVLRFQELVDYAKDNYVEHKLVHEQILERTRSGVGRGVDLELATGRLALAESNLLTEVSNLHDVTARFVRIVGTRPPADLEPLASGVFADELPESIQEALEIAYALNPSLKAAMANIRSNEDLVHSRRSAHHPRLDLRARQQFDRNLDGVRGTQREGVIELVLNYNLYRGGGDQARLRQAAEELNFARDQREIVCRNLRQTLTIAYNDGHMLEEQLRYLQQHALSLSRAREAYRQQFEIGQRSLLDLLDGENEYFDARRAYANAAHNQMIARANGLAGMGRLLEVVGVMREDIPKASELAGEEDYVEAESVCAAYFPDMLVVDKGALLNEALESRGLRGR